MKILFSLSILMSFLSLSTTHAHGDKGIYGEDNRLLVSELPEDEFGNVKIQASSVLAQISNWRITNSDRDNFSVQTKDLQSGLNMCEGERFNTLPLVSTCTAFLVAADVIVTAGHCVKDKYECKKNTWVLDYDSQMGFVSPNGSVSFPKNKSYSCSELLAWSQNSKLDYAVIRLDRKVTDRAPLKIRREGKVQANESLIAIGHPLGLPKMVSTNILIRDNSDQYIFKTNADTFSGNSGSPVIGALSGLVEGILVRGDDDFMSDIDQSCQRSARFGNKEGRGESVQRSTFLPFKYIPKF